jgi:hypothetical protein
MTIPLDECVRRRGSSAVAKGSLWLARERAGHTRSDTGAVRRERKEPAIAAARITWR